MIRSLTLALCAAGLSACGLIYTNIHGPRSYRSASPAEVKAASDDPLVQGKACNYSVLYLVAWGNGGYAAAVRQALKDHPDRILYDVKTDMKVKSILIGLYTKVCTKVTGRAAKA